MGGNVKAKIYIHFAVTNKASFSQVVVFVLMLRVCETAIACTQRFALDGEYFRGEL